MLYIGPDQGNYNVPAHWTDDYGTFQAVPDDDYAYIYDGKTVVMDVAEPNVRYLWLGYGGTLEVRPGASLRATEAIYPSGVYDGTVTQSGGEILTPLLFMGYDPSGTATYNLSGGTLRAEYSLDPNLTGSTSVMLGSEGGTARLIQTGGYLSFIHNSYVHIGNGEGSLGEVVITNGSFAVTRNQFNVGAYKGRGSFTMSGDVTVDNAYKLQVGYRGTGVFTQNGGIVRHGSGEQIYIGLSDANGGGLGIYNLTAGTLQLDGKRVYVGRGYYETTGVGVGEFHMSGGLLTGTAAGPMEMVVGQKSGHGVFNLSGGSVTTRRIFIASEPVSYDVVPVPEGIVNVSGDGLMEATAEIVVGRSGPGQLNISGGSVWASDIVIVGSDDPNAVGTVSLVGGAMTAGAGLVLGNGTGASGYVHVTGGSLTVPGPTLLAISPSCTGQFTASKDAYVQLGGLYVYSGEDRSTQVGVEVARNGCSLLHTTNVSSLDGPLDVQSLGGFRPREGDTFVIMTSTDPSGVHFLGNFSEFTSNITLGLPGPSAFSGAANGANYELTFLGYTAGDANGDHVVDGGDLSLLGGNWMQYMTGWGNCDFDGDGLVDGSAVVDGGDLALLSGNWLWSLPASPAPMAQPVPEPLTVALLALGGAGMARRRR